MSLLINREIRNVHLDQIDLNNDYKISKLQADEKLKQSILISGILEPPVLLKNNSSYQVISGHNRIEILKETNQNAVTAFILNVIKPEEFISFALLKNYRQEAGPIGKINFIIALKNIFKLDINEIFAAAKKMQIPEDVIHQDQPEKIMSLPRNLMNYIDTKDLGFKIIKNITRLPGEAVRLLSEWVAEISMRINIFKAVIDCIVDINKRDKSLVKLADIDLNSFSDKKRQDESLYHEIFKLRYPDYSEIKSKADTIINTMNREGMRVDFPEYFEKDDIDLVLKINKREGINTFREKINQIDVNAVKKLLELL